MSAIAQHERELLAKREQVDRDADRLIAEARAEARRIAEQEAERLAADVVAMRKEAEEVLHREQLEQKQQAEQRLNDLRTEAQTRADAVVAAVISLVLPASSGGHQ